MKHSIHKSRKQGNNHFGFSALEAKERRKFPWLGKAWFETGRDQERAKFIEKYHAETERMLKETPNLVLV